MIDATLFPTGIINYMQRYMRISYTLTGILFLAFSAAIGAQQNTEKYTPQTIFDLPWGNELMEFGYMKDGPEGREGLRWGPSSLTVNENQIYVLDTIQQKIKVFDMLGKLINHFSVDAIGDVMIAVDKDGSVWINDAHNYNLKKYDTIGNLKEKIVYGKRLDGVDCSLLIRDGKLYTSVWAISKGERSDSLGIKGERIFSGRKIFMSPESNPRHIGKNTKKYYQSGDNGICRVQKKDNGSKNDIYIKIPDSRSSLVIFVAEDKKNNAFFRVIEDPAKSSRKDWIYKYDVNYQLISKFELSGKMNYSEMQEPVAVDDNGNVFHLITHKSGVKLVKWSRYCSGD